jgi:hypothetical protein
VVPLFEDDIFLAAPAAEKLDSVLPADLRDMQTANLSRWPKDLPPMPGSRKPFRWRHSNPKL